MESSNQVFEFFGITRVAVEEPAPCGSERRGVGREGLEFFEESGAELGVPGEAEKVVRGKVGGCCGDDDEAPEEGAVFAGF